MRNNSENQSHTYDFLSNGDNSIYSRCILKIEGKGFVDRLDVVRERERSQRDRTGWMRKPSQG